MINNIRKLYGEIYVGKGGVCFTREDFEFKDMLDFTRKNRAYILFLTIRFGSQIRYHYTLRLSIT